MILLVTGISWGIPALNAAREQVLRFLNAPLVDPHALEGPVPGPGSAQPREEPSRWKPSASATPVPPPTGTPATEPLAPAPPTLSQEQPRESIAVTKPKQPKAKPPKSAKQVQERDRPTPDEITTSADLDGSLIDGYLRESDAKMKTCLNTSAKRGFAVDVPFIIDFDGTVSLSLSSAIRDHSKAAGCVTTYIEDVKRIKFPKSPNQKIIHRSFHVE